MKYKLIALVVTLSLGGCVQTTQLDKYRELEAKTNAVCSSEMKTQTKNQWCDLVEPVKPQTDKYNVIEKSDYIKDCKDRVTHDVMSKSEGIQVAVTFNEMSERQAIYLVKNIATQGRIEIKECNNITSGELRTINPDWLNYEKKLDDLDKCKILHKETKLLNDINKKECDVLTKELSVTEKGSYTMNYLTKHDDSVSSNIIRVIASPIVLPIVLLIDAISLAKD
jgi:uncharacterized protein YceK